MYSPETLATRIQKPTARVILGALILELYALVTVGKSPAYLDPLELSATAAIDLAYLSLVFILCSVPVILVLLLFSATANQLVYLLLLMPFRLHRPRKVKAEFLRRREFIDANIVENYAVNTHNHELLDELSKTSRVQPFPPDIIPVATLVLLGLIAYFSDAAHPNFLMKVCSLQEPVELCTLYYVVLTIAFMKAVFFMALMAWIVSFGEFFPKSKLPVPVREVLKHKDKDVQKDFASARETWMGRGRKD